MNKNLTEILSILFSISAIFLMISSIYAWIFKINYDYFSSLILSTLAFLISGFIDMLKEIKQLKNKLNENKQ